MQKPTFGRSLTTCILGFVCMGLLLAGVWWVSGDSAAYRPIPRASVQQQGPPPDIVLPSVDTLRLWGGILALAAAVISLTFLAHKRRMQVKRVQEDQRRQARENARTVYALCSILENWENGPGRDDHVMRVSRYARILAKLCGMSDTAADEIGTYAMLHDIGMLYVPRAILKKSGTLSPEEYARIKNHVEYGREMAEAYGLPQTARNIICCHHEQWDGHGYKQMAGRDIPLEARIVCLADTYDALRMERVYRPSYTHQEAVEVIREERGRMLDPELVDRFTEAHGLFEQASAQEG